MIRKWLVKRKQERKARAYENGYSFAASLLLSSEGDDATVMYIEDCISGHDAISSCEDFDKGGQKALEDWRNL